MYKAWGKRFFDVFGVIILIGMIGWLFILILIVYCILGEFPVFFRQARIGQDRQIFSIIKFRTLKTGEGTPQLRRYAWGDFLRATSLDELPQLFQVLIGKMSFIGPRPLPVSYDKLFSEIQHKRHTVRPGVSGWAQVNGRNAITWEKKLELDLFYVERISLSLDMKILWKTIRLLLSFKKDISLEEEPFKGN